MNCCEAFREWFESGKKHIAKKTGKKLLLIEFNLALWVREQLMQCLS